jgi:signal transduction histidine kinase
MGELGPQPGLVELADLVESTRRAGADVRLTDEVPAGFDETVELTVYRVVQEALSNAVRHAPDAAIEVSVRQSGDALEVTVHNTPPPGSPTPAPGSGHGLTGMRERVALVEGTVSAAPTPAGGYLVQAIIPVGQEVASGDHGLGG